MLVVCDWTIRDLQTPQEVSVDSFAPRRWWDERGPCRHVLRAAQRSVPYGTVFWQKEKPKIARIFEDWRRHARKKRRCAVFFGSAEKLERKLCAPSNQTWSLPAYPTSKKPQKKHTQPLKQTMLGGGWSPKQPKQWGFGPFKATHPMWLLSFGPPKGPCWLVEALAKTQGSLQRSDTERRHLQQQLGGFCWTPNFWQTFGTFFFSKYKCFWCVWGFGFLWIF